MCVNIVNRIEDKYAAKKFYLINKYCLFEAGACYIMGLYMGNPIIVSNKFTGRVELDGKELNKRRTSCNCYELIQMKENSHPNYVVEFLVEIVMREIDHCNKDFTEVNLEYTRKILKIK